MEGFPSLGVSPLASKLTLSGAGAPPRWNLPVTPQVFGSHTLHFHAINTCTIYLIMHLLLETCVCNILSCACDCL
jgi:hypothetical protein